MSLEYRLYYWLCLLLVLLTVFSTGITLYRSLYDVVDNVYHYSNQLLERADTMLVAELRELEEFAALSVDDLRDHHTTGRPYDDFKVANYHRDGLEFLVLSPQAQAGQSIRYTSHVLDDEIITVTEKLPPASPLVRALERQAAVNDAAPRWGKPFHLAQGDWLLPCYLRLSADRLFVLIVPLEVLYSHLSELDFIKEISTFLALAQQGGETQPALVGRPSQPAGPGFLSFVDVAEVVHRRPSAWSVLVSGASDIILYHPDALLSDLYLGLSHDITEVYERLQYHLLQTFLLTLAGVGMFFILIRRVFKSFSRSLGDLQQQLTVTSEDDHLEFRLPENQRYREFAQIARAINHMFKRLQSDVTDLQQETRKSAALANELAIAGSIQQNLLPDDAGVNRINSERGVDIGALLAPATTVAGDFYYVIPRVDGKLLLAIGDVSGKGVAAALVASDCVNLIEFYGEGLSPEILLEKVNSILYRKFADQSMFVTLFCALLDPETGDLTHSSAGHEPPLLCRAGDNRIARLAVEPGMALGFLADTVYHSQATRLEQDQVLLLYTDGLDGGVELQNNSLELQLPLGVEILTNRTLEHADLQTRLHCINQAAMRQQGGQLYDDITLLGIALETSGYRSFHVAPERGQAGVAISRLRALLAGRQDASACTDTLSIVLDEWVSNLVKYADVDSDIIVCLRCSGEGVDLEIIASCNNPFNPLEAPEVDIDEYMESGSTGKLGIHMMRNLTDELGYDSDGTWTRLRARVNHAL